MSNRIFFPCHHSLTQHDFEVYCQRKIDQNEIVLHPITKMVTIPCAVCLGCPEDIHFFKLLKKVKCKKKMKNGIDNYYELLKYKAVCFSGGLKDGKVVDERRRMRGGEKKKEKEEEIVLEEKKKVVVELEKEIEKKGIEEEEEIKHYSFYLEHIEIMKLLKDYDGIRLALIGLGYSIEKELEKNKMNVLDTINWLNVVKKCYKNSRSISKDKLRSHNRDDTRVAEMIVGIERKIEENVLLELSERMKSPKLEDFEILKKVANLDTSNHFVEMLSSAKGATAVVYKAKFKDFPYDFPLALKVLFNDCVDGNTEGVNVDEYLNRHIIEEIATDLEDTNVLNVINYFTDIVDPSEDLKMKSYIDGIKNGIFNPKTVFFVFPYMKCDLKYYIENLKKEIDEFTFLSFAKDLLAGICALHKQGIVHRDLKPNNLMLTYYDKLVIIDMGLHLDCRKKNYKDFIVPYFKDEDFSKDGNAMYKAPEIYHCQPGESVYLNYSKNDIFAAGLILHKLLNPKNECFVNWEKRIMEEYQDIEGSYTNDIKNIVRRMCHPKFDERIDCYSAFRIVSGLYEKNRRDRISKILTRSDAINSVKNKLHGLVQLKDFKIIRRIGKKVGWQYDDLRFHGCNSVVYKADLKNLSFSFPLCVRISYNYFGDCNYRHVLKESNCGEHNSLNFIQSRNHPRIMKPLCVFDDKVYLNELPDTNNISESVNGNQTMLQVFPYLNGNMQQLVALKKNRLKMQIALYYIRDILQGIVYLYKNKVVHRDLKPDNIMISSDGSLKLIDFELLLMFEDDRQDFKVYLGNKIFGGSAFYFPPEILGKLKNNEILDYSKSDIFSVGLIFYEMLSHTKECFGKVICTNRKEKDYIELDSKIPLEIRNLVRKMCNPVFSKRATCFEALNQVEYLIKKYVLQYTLNDIDIQQVNNIVDGKDFVEIVFNYDNIPDIIQNVQLIIDQRTVINNESRDLIARDLEVIKNLETRNERKIDHQQQNIKQFYEGLLQKKETTTTKDEKNGEYLSTYDDDEFEFEIDEPSYDMFDEDEK